MKSTGQETEEIDQNPEEEVVTADVHLNPENMDIDAKKSQISLSNNRSKHGKISLWVNLHTCL